MIGCVMRKFYRFKNRITRGRLNNDFNNPCNIYSKMLRSVRFEGKEFQVEDAA